MLYKKRGLWLLIPGLAGFIIFYIAPFIFSFYYATIKSAFEHTFVGFDNFIQVLSNQYYGMALKNTFLFTAVSVPSIVILSFSLAVLLLATGKKMNFTKASFIIPILIPSVSVVMLWHALFGENGFIIQAVAKGIMGITEDNAVRISVYAFYLWKNTGYNVILFMAGIMSIPKEMFEVSEMEGATFFKTHYYVTFPLLLPTTSFVVIISIVNSLKIFKEVYLLYGAYPYESIYLVQHYMNNNFFKLNYQNLAAGAIVFALMVYIIVAVGLKTEDRLTDWRW